MAVLLNARFAFFALIVSLLWSGSTERAFADKNHQYMAWTHLPQTRESTSHGGYTDCLFPVSIPLPEFQVQELIPSWNVILEQGEHLNVFIHASFDDGESKKFHLGKWAPDKQSSEKQGLRTSINAQNDEWGVVYTDTLVFKKKPVALSASLQLFIKADHDELLEIDFFGVCLSGKRPNDSLIEVTEVNEEFVLNVPRLCQRDYIGGGVWCSPTSVTMILKYWSEEMLLPELNYTVPEAAQRTFDPGWSGTGNWAFNMAFAGSHSDIRAFVTRLNSLSELRSLLQEGLPIAVSVSYDLLKGKSKKGNNDGHLVVVVGFNENGDPIFNDPAACPDVTRSYPMAHFIKAWQSSRQTAYIIYPSDTNLPEELGIQWN